MIWHFQEKSSVHRLLLLLIVKAISKDASPWTFCVLSSYCTDRLTIHSKDKETGSSSQSPPKDRPGWCLISPCSRTTTRTAAGSAAGSAQVSSWLSSHKDHLCYPQPKSGSIPISGPFWGLTNPSHGVLWKVPIWPRLLSGQPEAEFTGFPGFQHAQAEPCSCRNSFVGKISAYAGFTELWGCLPAHLPMDLLRSIALFL